MIMLSTVIIATLLSVTYAQIPAFGRCPSVEVVPNFASSRYLGRWYEQTKYPIIFQLYGKCTTADYGTKPDGNVTVLNRQISTLTNREISISGTARIVSNAKLAVTFEIIPITREAPYWVLGTDYDNYAVVYSCNDIGSFLSLKNVWILTRQQHPSSATIAQAFSVLDDQHISKQYLIQTEQSGCPPSTASNTSRSQ